MKLDLLFILQESIEKVLLDEPRLLKELEIEIVDFKSERDIKLSRFVT